METKFLEYCKLTTEPKFKCDCCGKAFLEKEKFYDHDGFGICRDCALSDNYCACESCGKFVKIQKDFYEEEEFDYRIFLNWR